MYPVKSGGLSHPIYRRSYQALNPLKEEFGDCLLIETLLGSRIVKQLNSFPVCLQPLTVSHRERNRPTTLRASPLGGEIY